MNNIKVVVFDLYNTLIEIKESNNFFLKLFRTSQNGFDLDISAYLHLVMTKDIEDLINVLPADFETLYNENRSDLEQELNSVIVYEDVRKVLEELRKDFRIFLISNLASPYKKPVFTNELDTYFERMIFSSDYGFLKPNKEIFKEIEILTNNKPNEILMVGDSFKSDILGAKNMGWHYLRIKRIGNLTANHEIRDLYELEKLISKPKL